MTAPKQTVTVEVRLPQELIDELRALAKLAGLSVESVMKIAIATEARRWQRFQQQAKP